MYYGFSHINTYFSRALKEEKTVASENRHSSNRATTQLKMVELCYQYAYLVARNNSGLELDEEERRQLALLQDMLEGDPQGRRRHRRFPLKLPAMVKTCLGYCSGYLLNLSGEGMLLEIPDEVYEEESVQVKVGWPGEVEYLFTCTSTRVIGQRDLFLVGLSFSCVPVEIRRCSSAFYSSSAA
jgi:hypothetical protein